MIVKYHKSMILVKSHVFIIHPPKINGNCINWLNRVFGLNRVFCVKVLNLNLSGDRSLTRTRKIRRESSPFIVSISIKNGAKTGIGRVRLKRFWIWVRVGYRHTHTHTRSRPIPIPDYF
uniref:Uncharacterized protein n=1 Tax=Opuntia streptacantha TaxID=393608 RepID=A0A7C9A9R2_OPUST